MSVNYYAKTRNTETKEEELLHVGLSSGGRFQFRAHPLQQLLSFEAWQAWLARPDTILEDEYGQTLLLERFYNFVVRKRDEVIRYPRHQGAYHNAHPCYADAIKESYGRYLDAEGHLFGVYEFS
jgi:hypothetical protein